MSTIKAKYAGECAKTGKSYTAGTEIKKGRKGWEIAGVSSSASSASEVETEIRNLLNGSKMFHKLLKRPLVCGACAKADPSYDMSRGGELKYRTEFHLRRDGDLFACPNCGTMKATVVGTEADWEHGILPRLKFEGAELNEKIGAARWEKVKQFFEYESYADIADWYDQCDEFDLAEQFEGMRGGRWTLKNEVNKGKVEELLGILPHNRHDFQPEPTEPEPSPEKDETPAQSDAAIELNGTPSTPQSPRHVAWIKLDAINYAGLDADGCAWIGRQVNTPPEGAWGYIQGRYAYAVKYDFDEANRNRVLELMPEWTRRAFSREDVQGRFRLPSLEGHAASAADAIRGCITSNQPLNQIEYTPDVAPLSVVKAEGAYAALVTWNDGSGLSRSFDSSRSHLMVSWKPLAAIGFCSLYRLLKMAFLENPAS